MVFIACAILLSKLDCCNSNLSDWPVYILSRLQKVQNSAAELVFKTSKSDHVQRLVRNRMWMSLEHGK